MIEQRKTKLDAIREVQNHHQKIIDDLLNMSVHLSVESCIEQDISALRTPNDIYAYTLKQNLKKTNEQQAKESTQDKEQ